MIIFLAPSAPSFILSAYGLNNKAKAIDILKRWLFIHNQCLLQVVRVLGFSIDDDARYLRPMRLCFRFFAELPKLNLFKHKDEFDIKIPTQWSWFLMQDPIHTATNF